MARNLGVAGIQMRVDKGEDNTAGMLKKLKSDDVQLLKFGFEWVSFVVWGQKSKRIRLR